MIDQAKMLYDKEIDRLCGFLHKSYKARLKWARTDLNGAHRAIAGEIGAALSGGRLDLVENLLQRKMTLERLDSQIQQLDYQARFSSNSVPLPTPSLEEKGTDSTLLLVEVEKSVASIKDE